MGGISGTMGLTEVVHLLKFAGFCQEINENVFCVVKMGQEKYFPKVGLKKINFPAPNWSGFSKS